MSPDLRDLVGLALACGAPDVGGPLSREEADLAARASRPSPSDVRRARSAIRDGQDPLGEAFCRLRSPLDRRPLGAFYTSAHILDPMVAWALSQTPTRFVDPGCGSGRFSVAALRANPRLEIVAVDLDPVATLLTRASLAVIKAKRARVIQADYLTADLAPHDGRTAFVGNPPYVRHHDLSPSTKAHATLLAAKVGHQVSGLAGLHALFYLATLARHGRRGDVGSFVTSAEWLDVGYGSVIRNMFTNGLGGRSLTVYDPETVPFEDAMTTAAITTFVLGQEPDVAHIARIVDATTPLTLEAGRAVRRAQLACEKRWSPVITQTQPTELQGERVGDLFKVSRGQVTGANGFFVMTKAEAKRRGLARWCVPVVTAADEVFAAGGILRNSPERLVGLEVQREVNPKRYPRLAAYLQEGEAAGIHRGYVASHRSPWWAVTYPKPPIVSTYMARQAPCFAANPERLGILNVLHGFHPRRPLDDDAVAQIVAALNAGRQTFVGRGRTYHGGLEKFEPSEMEALPLQGACRA